MGLEYEERARRPAGPQARMHLMMHRSPPLSNQYYSSVLLTKPFERLNAEKRENP